MGFDGRKPVNGASPVDPLFGAVTGSEQKPQKPLAGFTRADQVQVRPVDWLIEGWLARDSLAGLVGPSGSCKTFIALDWACRVATGTPWHGCEVQRGAVFILAGEGRNGLRKRIEGWSTHTGVSIEGAPLYLAAQLPPLDMPATAGIIEEIDAMADAVFFENGGAEPALVLIDTVARALVGDENSSEAMGALVKSADWLRERWPGCTVLAVHHTGHNNNGRARGSSAFYAALDSEALVRPLRSGDLQVFGSKCKDWAPPRPMQFRRHEVAITLPGTDLQTSTLVLVNTEMTTSEDRTAEVAELKAAGKTVRQIAEETGIPRSTVSRMLKDQKDARPIWEQEFDEAA